MSQEFTKALSRPGTSTIETQRLILRRFTYDDAAAVLENWAADPAVQNMYSEPVYPTKEAVMGLLEQYIGGYAKPNYYRWAIILKESGTCIGQIAYFLVDEKNHFAEIEYCIGRAFQCHGYATEATKAVVNYGFRQMHLHKVQICCKIINAPSKRVIEKCGFTYEGTLRDYFYIDGTYVGRHYFSILESEYTG